MHKTISALVLILGLSFSASNASAESSSCAVVSVESKSKDGSVLQGNGTYLGDGILVTNDHVLPKNLESIEVRFDREALGANLILRDEHHDLAWLKVADKMATQWKSCSLSMEWLAGAGDFARIESHFETNSAIDKIQGSVTNVSSRRLEVVGVPHAYEFVPQVDGRTALRSSMSGSPVFVRGKVIGILTQKTEDGIGLLIPSVVAARELGRFFTGTKTHPNYRIDRENRVARIGGLEVSFEPISIWQDQGETSSGEDSEIAGLSGGPHDRSKPSNGGPHDLAKRPGGGPHDFHRPGSGGPHDVFDAGLGTGIISVGEQKVRKMVAARIVDPAALKTWQPELARLTAGVRNSKLRIFSVGGLSVKNWIEFLRVVTSCSTCQIDGYFIGTSQARHQVAPETGLFLDLSRLARYFGDLVKTKKFGTTNVSKMFENLESLTVELHLLGRERQALGGISPERIERIKKVWDQIEVDLLSLPNAVMVDELSDEFIHRIRVQIELTK